VNFSRVPGRRGTSRYLESRILELDPYVGVGLYASTLLGSTWGFNLRRLDAYEGRAGVGRLAHGDVYALPCEHLTAKLVIGMLSYGFIDPGRTSRRFGETLGARFGHELEWLVREGLLREHDGLYWLEPGAFGSLPGIRATFMPVEVLDWLRDRAQR
jgi:hypothetical protein